MVLVKLMYRGLFRLLKWKCSESDTLSDPSIQRIAAIDVTGSLGGTITLLPALKTLKEGFPGAELHFVTVPGFDDLLRDCSYIDRFVDAPTNSRLLGVLSLARRLRAARYDLACSLIPSKKNALLALLSGAEYRVGYLGFPRSAYPHIEQSRVSRGVHKAIDVRAIAEKVVKAWDCDEMQLRTGYSLCRNGDSQAGVPDTSFQGTAQGARIDRGWGGI